MSAGHARHQARNRRQLELHAQLDAELDTRERALLAELLDLDSGEYEYYCFQ